MNPAEGSERKLLWSAADFESMSWHDAHVHGVAAVADRYEVRLDLDYILEWLGCDEDREMSFLVAPATLVFENASDVVLQMASPQGEWSLQGIERSDEQRLPGARVSTWKWVLNANEGTLTLRASGYKQHLRSPPIKTSGVQRLDHKTRGGISFE